MIEKQRRDREIKAVLFDLDRTLLDRDASLKKFVVWQAEGMLRSQLEDPGLFTQRFIELDANGRVWKDEVYKILIEEFAISGWSVAELTTSYELCFSGFCQPKQGAIAAVKILHQEGFKLGLISNGKSPFQERNFNSLGISGFFDTVIVSAAVGLRKPDRAIFELAVQELGIRLPEAIFVGDNPIADIQGSKQAGMHSVYIPRYGEDLCKDADAVCKDFNNLPDIVRKAK